MLSKRLNKGKTDRGIHWKIHNFKINQNELMYPSIFLKYSLKVKKEIIIFILKKSSLIIYRIFFPQFQLRNSAI